jgi:uncharacterized membrane protein YkoI
MTRKKAAAALGAIVAIGAVAGAAAHAAGGSGPAPGSQLDDGRQYLSQAKISEREAIAAAQTRASGQLDEVDLEHANGRLVFNVDVGKSDVKVDATSGQVVAVDHDD